MIRCDSFRHDHTTPVDADGNDLAEPIPMRCVDCDVPTHYDDDAGTYVHDDENAPPCFLVPFRPDDASPCVPADGI